MNSLKNIHYFSSEFNLNFNRLDILGLDASAFLHSKTTSNILGMLNNTAKLSCALDRNSRIVGTFFVLKFSNEKLILLTPQNSTEKILSHLDSFVISEDVSINISNDNKFRLAFNVEPDESSFSLSLFGEKSSILYGEKQEVKERSEAWDSYWSIMTGELAWPGLISESRLFTDSGLSGHVLDLNKGCYLGQETVSKLMSNRGANYFPVNLLLKDEYIFESNEIEILVEDKKIGELAEKKPIICEEIKIYLARLNRENRLIKDEIKIRDQIFQIDTIPFFKDLTNITKSESLYQFALKSININNDILSAKKYLNQALKLNPKNIDVLEVFGRVLIGEKKYNEALGFFKKMLEIDSKSVMAHTNLSVTYMQIGQIEKAEEHKSLSLINSFQKIGEESDRKKKLDEEAREKLVALNLKMKMFTDVLEIDPDDILANWGIGDSYFQMGNLKKAKDYFSKTLNIDPRYTQAILGLSKVLVFEKSIEEAKTLINEGIKISAEKGATNMVNQLQQVLNSIGE